MVNTCEYSCNYLISVRIHKYLWDPQVLADNTCKSVTCFPRVSRGSRVRPFRPQVLALRIQVYLDPDSWTSLQVCGKSLIKNCYEDIVFSVFVVSMGLFSLSSHYNKPHSIGWATGKANLTTTTTHILHCHLLVEQVLKLSHGGPWWTSIK